MSYAQAVTGTYAPEDLVDESNSSHEEGSMSSTISNEQSLGEVVNAETDYDQLVARVEQVLKQQVKQGDRKIRPHVVVLFQAPSGSGKTQLVNYMARKLGLSQAEQVLAHISADSCMRSDATYKFDAKKLAAAHYRCKEMFGQALKRGTRVVFVDNTNVQQEHYDYYVGEVNKHNRAQGRNSDNIYRIVKFTLEDLCPHLCELLRDEKFLATEADVLDFGCRVLEARSVNHIPRHVVRRQLEQHIYPEK